MRPGDWVKGTIIGTNPGDGETWYPAGNGKMNTSALRTCLDKYIASGTTVLIPIYDTLSSKPSGDNLAYHIVGLAAFVLTAGSSRPSTRSRATSLDYYAALQRAGRHGMDAAQTRATSRHSWGW